MSSGSSAGSPPHSEDRRAHRRAPLTRPVLVETSDGATPVPAQNVSGGGLAVAAELTLQVGAIVDVYFELPVGYAVETRAEVVRIDGTTLAFRFLELEREALVALRSFCRISGLHRLSIPGPAAVEGEELV